MRDISANLNNTAERIAIARKIIRMRISQMAVNEEYKAGKFKIPVHLAMGHETVAVAVDAAMQDGDVLLLSHRNIAYHLARINRIQPILDEYLLKPTGLSGGKFGSMNMINPEKGVFYTSSILGNQFPVATGMAMSKKILGEKTATIVLVGDGSVEEGSFYESILIARSMELPVLFLVENNEWSLATRIDERRCPIDFSLFAESFDVRYAKLEGNNPFAYADALKELRAFAVGGNTPVCTEVVVSTLGDWRGPKTPECPEGRIINYHAGSAPTVLMSEWPVIKEDGTDPVFALLDYIDEKTLREIAKEEYSSVKKELA